MNKTLKKTAYILCGITITYLTLNYITKKYAEKTNNKNLYEQNVMKEQEKKYEHTLNYDNYIQEINKHIKTIDSIIQIKNKENIENKLN